MRFYIDPGTGSMLFTILIGVLGAAVYALRGAFVKLRFLLSTGKAAKADQKKLPLVIFAESKRYWNVFGPVCDELERRGQETWYYTCSEDDPVFHKGYSSIHPEFIGAGNKAFAKLNMLQARVLLSTTPGLDVYQWKRSKSVDLYVHMLHAPADVTLYRLFGIDYYDAILLSGEYQIRQVRALEELRNLPAKELALTGVPYLDVNRQRLEAAGPVPEHPVTVLLAPSWGKSGILSRYGEEAIDALLATGYQLIIRPHPQSFVSEKDMLDRLMAKYPQVEWNRDNDNFEVLRRSDILISDFSGVIFDFALVFDKPVIYADTSFDDSPYDSHWLEEAPWTFSVLPRIGHQLTAGDLAHVKDLIDECLEDERFILAREEARNETWVCRGNGASAIADWLIEKLQGSKKDGREE